MRTWWRYLAVPAVPIVLSPFLLTSQWGQTATTVAVGYAAVLACAWRRGTGRGVPSAWLWIAAGLFLNASGSVVESLWTQVLAITTVPTPADALYLALYPCMTVGLLAIVRSRHPGLGPAKLIDATTLTVGMALLCWIFLIRPAAAGASGSMFARAVDIAYPVGDLMLLAILARVMAAEGWRTPAVRLLSLGLLAFLLGDSAWALVNDNGWNTSAFQGAMLGEPFLFAFSLIGLASLHPSTNALGSPAPDTGERTGRALLGSLTLASMIAPAVLASEALSGRVTDGLAIAIASALLMALVVARLSYVLRQVQQHSARLRELALEDDLTGLPNRRALQSYLGDALQRARRSASPLSLALLDLDHFKRFNDELGHSAGDQLLKSAAAAWSSEVRATDMLARIGGEEFVLVLPEADIEHAGAVLEKLRALTPREQTFSAGLAQWDGEALPEELIDLADAAMYAAKHAGRDRICRVATAGGA